MFDLIGLLVFLSGDPRGKRGGKAVILFFYLSLLVTPFLMTVLLGGTPAMRSQMVLPAATGFLGYLGLWLLQARKGASGGLKRQSALICCGAVICLVCGIQQAKVTGLLYYTDWCRYEQDAALGRSIIERIEQINREYGVDGQGEALPVIMIGGREFSGNNACVTGEVIGRSFFNYDREVEPVGYWSTRRALGFLHTLGADYEQVPKEWVGDAAAYSEDMPVWPAEGSIQVKGSMMIVKLSSE